MAKGRPKKKKSEVRVNLNVRVDPKTKRIVDKWGKGKGKKLDEMIQGSEG